MNNFLKIRFWLKWMGLSALVNLLAVGGNLLALYGIVQSYFQVIWLGNGFPQNSRFLVKSLIATVVGLWLFSFQYYFIFNGKLLFLAGIFSSLIQFQLQTKLLPELKLISRQWRALNFAIGGLVAGLITQGFYKIASHFWRYPVFEVLVTLGCVLPLGGWLLFPQLQQFFKSLRSRPRLVVSACAIFTLALLGWSPLDSSLKFFVSVLLFIFSLDFYRELGVYFYEIYQERLGAEPPLLFLRLLWIVIGLLTAWTIIFFLNFCLDSLWQIVKFKIATTATRSDARFFVQMIKHSLVFGGGLSSLTGLVQGVVLKPARVRGVSWVSLVCHGLGVWLLAGSSLLSIVSLASPIAPFYLAIVAAMVGGTLSAYFQELIRTKALEQMFDKRVILGGFLAGLTIVFIWGLTVYRAMNFLIPYCCS